MNVSICIPLIIIKSEIQSNREYESSVIALGKMNNGMRCMSSYV